MGATTNLDKKIMTGSTVGPTTFFAARFQQITVPTTINELCAFRNATL